MTFVIGLIPNSQIPRAPLNVPGPFQFTPPLKVRQYFGRSLGEKHILRSNLTLVSFMNAL